MHNSSVIYSNAARKPGQITNYNIARVTAANIKPTARRLTTKEKKQQKELLTR